MQHESKIEEYKELKEKLKNEQDCICTEFYFTQNLPLSKITVSAQFYRGLLWLFSFNIHVFNNNNSYMFTLLEGITKEGANTVCNFLFYLLKELGKIHFFNVTEILECNLRE